MSMSHSTGVLQSHNTESKQGDLSIKWRHRRMYIAGYGFTRSLPFRQSPKFISADKVECEFPSMASTSPGI